MHYVPMLCLFSWCNEECQIKLGNQFRQNNMHSGLGFCCYQFKTKLEKGPHATTTPPTDYAQINLCKKYAYPLQNYAKT